MASGAVKPRGANGHAPFVFYAAEEIKTPYS